MSELGLRARKKQRARQQLIDAAFELFTERGFDRTTVADVAAAVEMSPRTFFRYFESKEEVVLAWLDGVGVAMIAALQARPPEEPPFLALRRALAGLVAALEGEREHLVACERLLAATAQVRAHKLEKIASWAQALGAVLAKRGRPRGLTRAQAQLLATVAMAILQSAQDSWIAAGARGSLARMVEQAFAVFEVKVGT